MTKKTFNLSILVLFASCLPFLKAQDCDNPLLNTFGLTGLPAPISGNTLTFCSNLIAGETCCSNVTVASFQTLINDLSTRLQNAASARDRYVLQLRDQYGQQYHDAASNLSLLQTQISNLQAANTTIGNEIANQRDQIEAINDALVSLDSNFQANFQNYQNARVNCFNTVLKVQASAWCLACDPNYASLGVFSNGTIAFDPNLCNTISQACYPFLDAADNENPLYRARQSFQRLQGLLTYIANFTATGGIPNTVLQGDLFSSTNATERTVTIPPGCTDAGNCLWQCQNLFSRLGVLNEANVANGAGLIGGGDIDFGAIGQSGTSARMLQNTPGTWNPDIESTRLSIVVVGDPAGVTDTTSGTRIVVVPISAVRFGVESAVVGLLGFIVSIMLLQ